MAANGQEDDGIERVTLSRAESAAPGEPQSSGAASVERYRQILNSAIETGIITMDRDGLVTSWSVGATRILGWDEADMLGQSLEHIFPPETGAAQLATEIAEAESRGRGGHEGWRVRKNGEPVWAIGETTPLFGQHGRPVGFVKILRDRTEERATEIALREETRALEILNRAGMALTRETDLARLVQVVTDAGVSLAGAEFGAFFYNVADAGGGRYTLYSLSGAPREAFAAFPMPRNTAIFEPTFAGTAIVRSDDITADPRYGRNAPHAGTPPGHLPVRSYLAVPVVSRSGQVLGGLFFGHSKPGVFTVRSEQRVGGLAAEAAIAIDNARLHDDAQREITERRRAEAALRELNANLEDQVRRRTEELNQSAEALRQSQKMEALGHLTGGVAHDFNNLLQIVVGNLETLSRNLPADLPGDVARLRRAIDRAMTGASRAAALTQRLLAFGRRQPLDPKPVDVNLLVSRVSELLHRTLGETVEIESVLDAGVWRIEADPNELENALINLAVNARDAMPDGGKLTIETANDELDPAYAARHAEVVAGQYVAISVSDTGLGMTDETRLRAFEPFFTTKSEGRGTGLGLSQVYGFVKQSRGHVKIYSEFGQGTTVRIYLPRRTGALEQDPAPERTQGAERAAGETILVVEDDEDVRAYSVESLRAIGYRVLEASNGAAALDMLASQHVDLIFTDVVLPGGMTGADVVARARERMPTMRALFTTGYARNAIVHHGRLDRGVQLLTKPFSFDALAAKVREVLAAPYGNTRSGGAPRG